MDPTTKGLQNFVHNFVHNKGSRSDHTKRYKLSSADKLNKGLLPVRIDRSHLLRSQALDLASEIEKYDNLPPGISGTWKKDRDASDDMTEACDLVALPFILRKALLVLNKLEIIDTDAHFQTNIKAGGILDVRESYPKTGSIVDHPRRDKRRGKHRGRVFYTEDGNHPCIEAVWDDPYGGECWDTFVLSSDGRLLEQQTEMKMLTGKETKYKTVYHRV